MIRALLASVLITAAPASPDVAFVIDDPRITEASGLALSIATPGLAYVQNDSGDTNRVFAVSTRTGRTKATVTVPGATNTDWEDLAVATDTRGRPSLWIADTGDNGAVRDEVQFYRVDEPRRGQDTTGRPDVWRLRYPGGPVDAESLAVAPGGAAYLVTKSLTGASTVYRVPPAPDANRVQTLTRVADLTFTFTGTPGGPNVVGQLTATGAAFSRDGSTFVVRTYTDAYVWPVRDGDVAAAVAAEPRRVALPSQPQGEGIAVDGDRLLIDSEGVRQPVYSVALPRATPTPTPTPTSTTLGSGGPQDQLTHGSRSLTDGPTEPDDGVGFGAYAVGGGAVVVIIGVAVIVARRRRTGHRAG